jgi:O-antigen/teichoic acid export membrane protein
MNFLGIAEFIKVIKYKDMSKYKQLFSNTIIFTVSNFASGILSFILLPFYTRVLNTRQFGNVDLLSTTVNLVVPVFTLCIVNAVLRLTLDKGSDKKRIFSLGFETILCGFLILLFLYPLLTRISYINNYLIYFYLLYIFSALNSLLSNFVRAIGKIKLCAFAGMLTTLTLLVSNILLLAVFRLGSAGYLISMILSNLAGFALQFWLGGIAKYLSFTLYDKALYKSMLVYSIPLIPNALSWWVTNVSDRYIVTAYWGAGTNGLYSAANRIPSMINVLSTIFMQAWTLSAVIEYSNEGRDAFYSRIYKYYFVFLILLCSLIMLFVKIISRILFSQSFYGAWIYVPFLLIAIVFSCFTSFYGTIYMSAKKNIRGSVTIIIGALCNIGLNFILVPKYGALGAAFSTFISFFLIWIIRVKDTKRFVVIDADYKIMAIDIIILLSQAVVLISQIQDSMIYCIILFALLLFINLKGICTIAKLLIARLIKTKSRSNKNGYN